MFTGVEAERSALFTFFFSSCFRTLNASQPLTALVEAVELHASEGLLLLPHDADQQTEKRRIKGLLLCKTHVLVVFEPSNCLQPVSELRTKGKVPFVASLASFTSVLTFVTSQRGPKLGFTDSSRLAVLTPPSGDGRISFVLKSHDPDETFESHFCCCCCSGRGGS